MHYVKHLEEYQCPHFEAHNVKEDTSIKLQISMSYDCHNL